MENVLKNPVPEKWRVLSGSMLKLVAVLCMVIDHVAAVFVPQDAFYLCTLFSKQITLYMIMRLIGRVAFPIFAFLIVEGALHTRSRVRYTVNLFVFALISEIPFDLVFFDKPFYFGAQNIFFTLLFGCLGICLFEKFQGFFWKQLLCVAGVFVLAMFFRADGGARAYVFILLIYALQEQRLLQAVTAASGLLPGSWRPGLAYIPLMLYNGKRGFIRGNVLKYMFYAVYPLHMLLLYFIGR